MLRAAFTAALSWLCISLAQAQPVVLADARLQDHRGHGFDAAALRGHPVLLQLVFTTCSSTCPTQVADLVLAHRALPDDVRRRLRVHLDTHDVMILSGGVSMGRLDLVPRALEELGVKVVFHKSAQRPGKPMWFGIAPSGSAVFALPGNPVSTLVCLSRYVVPALYAAMGQAAQPLEKIALAAPVQVKAPLAYFMPVQLAQDDWGRAWAHPVTTNGSGDFTSLTGTDGFVELPPGPNDYPKGFVTRLWRW